jgi:small subunit ribosomal protein S9
MATKKVVKNEEDMRYHYAVGRRKTAIALVRLYPTGGEEVAHTVNGKAIDLYFGTEEQRLSLMAPLKETGLTEKFRLSLVVRGGGKSGQADAVKLGIARALLKDDIALRKAIKGAGYLTRDARSVERKKPGLKKARRAPQWAKR